MSVYTKATTDFLQREFNLTITTKSNVAQGKEVIPKSLDGKGYTLPSELEKALNNWKNDYNLDGPTLANRRKLWRILDQMAHNNGPVSKTVKLYKNETLGSKISYETIQVKCKTRKQERWIKNFLQSAGYSKSTLEAIVEDLVIFGNGLAINSLDPVEGIAESTLTDPFSLQERMEFNPVRIKHQREGGYDNYNTQQYNRGTRMDQLVQAIEDPRMKTSEFFKSTLLGYRIDDFVFSPWQVAHFRMPTSRNEFAPYGKPLLLPALAPYMTWKATKDLIALARIASFPKEIITLEGAENTPIDMMFQRLQELKEIEENLAENAAQDTTGVGQKIYTIDGVFKYDLKQINMDLSAIGDLDAEMENVISALDVPVAYLIQGKERGFGESNKTLVAQSKVFAKAVYSIQSAILETLITQVKIQMILTGDYDPDKDYFELSMPLPTVDDDPELVRLYQERLRLAKDTAETIRDLLGLPVTTQLPQDTIRSILSSMSAVPSGDLDVWVDTIANDSVDMTPEVDSLSTTTELTEAQKITIRTKLNEAVMQEAIMIARENSACFESVENDRHFMASTSTSKLDKRILEEISSNIKTIKLKESDSERSKADEEEAIKLRAKLYAVTPDLKEEEV